MVPKEITEFLEKKKALDAHMSKIGQASLKGLFAELFEKDEQIVSIRWTQYTPHFNDGDPCVFYVHDPEVKLDGVETGGWNNDGYLDSYHLEKEQSKRALAAALGDFHTTVQELESIFNTVFGDGVQVTVYRNGEIEIDEHEHD